MFNYREKNFLVLIVFLGNDLIKINDKIKKNGI